MTTLSFHMTVGEESCRSQQTTWSELVLKLCAAVIDIYTWFLTTRLIAMVAVVMIRIERRLATVRAVRTRELLRIVVSPSVKAEGYIGDVIAERTRTVFVTCIPILDKVFTPTSRTASLHWGKS